MNLRSQIRPNSNLSSVKRQSRCKPSKVCFFYTAAVLLISLLLFILPQESYAENPDPNLYKRVEEMESIIKKQQEQLKHNQQMLQELKKDLASQKETVAAEKKTTEEMVVKILDGFRIDYRKPTSEEKRLETIYDDGFYLRGEDDTLKIGGWFQIDTRFYLDEDSPQTNTFDIRRARFDVRGVLENDFSYRLYATFVGSPVLQEAWLEYQYFPYARIKIGQYKEPFSLESQYSARWIDFVERSIGVTNLQPAEDIGVMVFGKFLDNHVDYAIGFFNGQGRDAEAVVDDKDLAGRLVVQPFRHMKDSSFKDLYIGGSFTYGNNERSLGRRDFRTAGRTPFYDFASDAQLDGRIVRYDGELEWLNGPFNFTTEFIGTDFEEIVSSSGNGSLTVNSWYGTLSYVLTGENAVRSKPIKPFKNFDLRQGGWGAWQILGRYEHFWTDDDLLDKGIATGTDAVDAFSIGLNWWPNIHLKFMFDYVYSSFDDEITVAGETLKEENVVLMRGQYNF